MKKLNEDITQMKQLAGLNEDADQVQELQDAINSVIAAAGTVDLDVIKSRALRIGNGKDQPRIAKLIECLNYSAGFLGTLK